MQRRINRYIWIVALWLILLGGFASPACAYTQTNLPTYNFRSTSAYAPMVGTSTYTVQVYAPGASSPMRGPRREGEYNPWDEEYDDEGNPGGLPVGQMETPVGEPLILLVFALLYFFFTFYLHNSKKCCNFARNFRAWKK